MSVNNITGAISEQVEDYNARARNLYLDALIEKYTCKSHNVSHPQLSLEELTEWSSSAIQ